ncbi:MAG: GHKL domain-containing protein [Verrucomicrobiaceae bacterium]|nr:GHKL domain-containing protein [Verrucomicrobiaceae bacterium]
MVFPPHRSLDPELLSAIGRMAQADGIEAIDSLLRELIPKITSAHEIQLIVQPEDGVARQSIEKNERIVVKSVRSKTDGETTVLAAWPLGTGENPPVAMMVRWTDGNEGSDEEMALLDVIVALVDAAMKRSRVRNELEILTESRTQSVQAVNDELETFAYTMSHDLKTPLTIMKTSIWTVKRLLGNQLDPRSAIAMNRLESTVERMRDQVDGMLHMYRLTKDDLSPEEVDVSTLCQDLLNELHTADAKRNLQVEITPGLTVRGDPVLLRVVFTNLLDNAWKYTSNNETTEITVGATRDPNGGLVLFVRDNGAGFDMAKEELLFSVFQRLHGDDEFEGSGIGLASVQRIINKHGGRVWAESKAGQGATFFFSLPDELPSDGSTS